MKDTSDTVNFWGKQKPLNHYFEHGVIKFSVKGDKLYYTIKVITKLLHAVIKDDQVRDKNHLDHLLAIKSVSEVLQIP